MPVPAPAPWRSSFLTHISQMPSPEFTLATTTTTRPFLPRARTCIFRGFWTALPTSVHNPAPRNPPIYESDCLTFTTDARSEKVRELTRHPEANRDGSGGADVEAVFWAREAGVQWRVRGKAYVLDLEEADREVRSHHERVTARVVVSQWMRRVGEGTGWSWKREVEAHFGNMAPVMRGSFKAPPPGKPVDEEYDSASLKQGELVEDLQDPVARENFRVVVITPFEVEATDLNDMARARRRLYTLEELDEREDREEQWTEVETWP
ncbi:hypothetical protein EJ06DRAFT_533905 [Trichodelitschia bisporula]|uniref:Pyridoxamine 5'-phosphate oxidase Alr4036 family FMN-binding domain-containing protein n=1 Tax=Trichodelitschia bisporula TaxID=703511 RepID=A0A6G1HKV5_9PEZI|nr:hypothetical protein EJ06DRAFT_533905 [Trichodelitschia bisporula]